MSSTALSPPAARQPALAALFGYAAPQLALSALYFPVFIFLVPYYDVELGLSAVALGAVIVAVRLLDAVTDPVMGAISDATRSRFGRRKIWLILSTPLVCLAVWMAFVPPEGAGVGYFALWVTVLSLAWTMAITPYLAWGAELASDYAGRSRVSGWRETATLIGMLVALAIYGAAEGDPAAGLERIALLAICALPVGVALAAWLTPSPPPCGQTVPPLSLSVWRENLRAMRSNEAFRRFFASHLFNSAANGLPPALFLYFVTAVLGGDSKDLGLAFAVYLAAAVLGAPIWTALARRGSKHRVWGWAMLYAMAVFAAVPLLGPGDITAFLVISGLTGFAYGADLALPPAIQADVVDADTAATGVDRTGVYFAVVSVVLKGASGLAGGAALILLGVVGFDSGGAGSDAAGHTPLALTTLTALYAIAPILLKGAAVAMIWRFPIDAATQAELRRRIDAAAPPA